MGCTHLNSDAYNTLSLHWLDKEFQMAYIVIGAGELCHCGRFHYGFILFVCRTVNIHRETNGCACHTESALLCDHYFCNGGYRRRSIEGG